MSAGHTEEAVAVLQETERVNPAHCNAAYNLGTTLIRLFRYQDALAPLSRALACYEREGRVGVYLADTYFNLGVAFSRLGRSSEAEAHFRALLRIAPSYPGGRIALGEVLARQRNGSPGRP